MKAIKSAIWSIRYTGILFFAIAFNSRNWFEFHQTSYYNNYGLFISCKALVCGPISTKQDDGFYTSAFVPRILMITAIVFISFGLLAAVYDGLVDLRYSNALIVTVIYSMLEILGGALILSAFFVAFIFGADEDPNTQEDLSTVGISAITALLSGLLFLASAIGSIAWFCMFKERNEIVIQLDKSNPQAKQDVKVIKTAPKPKPPPPPPPPKPNVKVIQAKAPPPRPPPRPMQTSVKVIQK